MKLIDAREQFISSWGSFATDWGINRIMAQVFALLLISPEALSAEDIMQELGISQGAANQNIRELVRWRLITRSSQVGSRKEYFTAEKDIWKITTIIIAERKKRELEPMLTLLADLSDIQAAKDQQKELQALKEAVKDVREMGEMMNGAANIFIQRDRAWLGKILKIFK